jgi:hypothetical protein
MGMWLSGYAGHYGNRFDQCGYETIGGNVFPEASGAIPVLSHMMLTGETVMDGPELIWQQDMQELATSTTADGYTRRNWGYFPQFVNISIDLFRKVLDGSVRILSREEVVDRTKVVIVQDINNGNVDDKTNFMTPAYLFKGLYQLDYDGEWLDNGTWMKSTGRYPAIPTVYELLDDVAQSFPVQIKSSEYDKRWPTIATKQKEMNELFAEQSTGTAFVDRVENAWVCYNPNPYLTETTADAAFSFNYNTCTGVEMVLNQFSLLQLREFTDSLCCYMTNYRTDDLTLRTDTLRILGATSTPTYRFTDRGDHPASTVVGKSDARGYLLTVTHRGPLDLTVYCSGAEDRSSAPAVTPAVLVEPAIPAAYNGTRQYEAESFDYKNVGECVKKGYGASYGLTDFSGQGYLYMGKNANVAVRDTVTVPTAGTYTLTLRYSAPKGAVRTVTLYVNGARVTTMNLTKDKTDGWQTYTRKVTLKSGRNEVLFSSTSALTTDLYFDYILIDPIYDETDTALVDSLLSITPVMTVSRTYLEGFKGYVHATANDPLTVRISGRGMQGAMTFTTSEAYELALEGDSVFSSTLTVAPNAFGVVNDTDLKLRLKSGLDTGTYTGSLTCQAAGVATRTVSLLGSVTPAEVSLVYDFESDATATPSTTPAADVKSGAGNSCTAGIVNYTAAGDSAASHWMKLQAATKRNNTGVLTLSRFTTEATDYSVTWRQCVASASSDYKVGVLLRGDDQNVGTASVGYVQGIMRGYVFIANYNRSSAATEFRIYKSTESTELSMLCNASVSTLDPDAKEAVYFRASAQGSSSVTLTFDYSLDGVTWTNVARTNDATSTRRLQGATQIVWGLAATTTGIYLDDITFRGITYDEAVTDLPVISDTEFQQCAVKAYYSLTGLQLQQPERGRLVIERKTYPDGRIVSRKVVY